MNTFRARNIRFASTAVAMATLLVSTSAFAADVVNIYSYRQPDLIAPLLKAFTDETGVATNVLFLDKGLEERIAAEGINSPADIILTVDIGRLTDAKEKGVTQPYTSPTLEKEIPAAYRDAENHWHGVTLRARSVYASKDRVAQDSISYEELADPKWKGKICTRSGQHAYNIGLFSQLYAHWGPEKTEEWLNGLKANLAKKPEGGDRDQAKSIAAGECDLALGNTYYVGLMTTNEKEPEQKEWAKAIKVFLPHSDEIGTDVNVSGVALTKNAPNKENAIKLIEFLASEKAQKIYGDIVYEYPANPKYKPNELIASFGELKADKIPLSEAVKHRKAVSEILDKIAFDDGADG
ncbi:MAG: extracellular solute-binding protein [Phyllobacterium sp.]